MISCHVDKEKRNEAIQGIRDVVQFGAVDQAAVGMAHLRAHGTIRQVTLSLEHAAKVDIAHNTHIAIRTVFVSVMALRFVVIGSGA